MLDEADRLLDTGNQEAILKLHQKVARNPGGRLQTLLFSATLHDPKIKQLSATIQQHPTWVDLKGKDAVPETVHHLLVRVDPSHDPVSWKQRDTNLQTDGVHRDDFNPNKTSAETYSEAIKRLKPSLVLKLIDAFQMSQAFIFVRTQLDADMLEEYFLAQSRPAAGGGKGKKFAGKVEKGVEAKYSCVVLHGGRQQKERQRNLDAFKVQESAASDLFHIWSLVLLILLAQIGWGRPLSDLH
eukprot:SAG31_NODE_3531_length_4151_cov_2.125864_4_plen_241_part_00